MHGIYLIFDLIYDVFLTYCDMIELILYESIDEYVSNGFMRLFGSSLELKIVLVIYATCIFLFIVIVDG